MKGENLKNLPIAKQTRLQRSLRANVVTERNKRAWLAACCKNRKIFAVKNEQNVTDDDDDDDDVIVVTEAEYLRRMAVYEFMNFHDGVDVDYENVKEEDGNDGRGDCKEECQSSGMNLGSEVKGGGVDDDADVDGCKSSVELGSTSENGTNSCPYSDKDDDRPEPSSDEYFQVDEAELCTVYSPDYSSSDGYEEGRKRKVKSRNDENAEVVRVDGGVDDPVDETDKTKESTCDEEIQRRVDDVELNLHWPFESDKYGGHGNQGESSKTNESAPEPKREPYSKRLGVKAPKNLNVGVESKPEHEPKPENLQCPFKSDKYGGHGNAGESSKNNTREPELEPNSKSLGVKAPKNLNVGVESNPEHEPKPENLQRPFKSDKYGGQGNAGESSKNNAREPELEPVSKRLGINTPKQINVGVEWPMYEPEFENCGTFESSGKRKRGRPRKNSSTRINPSLHTRKGVKKLKPSEAENIMLTTILKNRNAGLNSSCVHSVTESQKKTSLPLKFRFGVQKTMPEISEEARVLESLFKDLEFGLRTSDIGAEHRSFPDENDDSSDCSAAVHEKLCHQGKHYLIHDEEIGIRCKYCSFVKLEIRHVTPAFYKNPFGSFKNKDYGRVPSDNNADASNSFHFRDPNDDLKNARANDIKGSVWELIPGIKDTLYPHQQEGFEFMWKNIGGGIKLDELGNPTKFGSGGCIICHAPGTGKTRLTITFLQSFVRMYPVSKPVIIAPKSVLLTWEEEFARWNIDVPFINMNKNELSGNENVEFLNCAEDVKAQQTIRTTKLYTWAMGKGILGISYNLFEKLAGDRKGVNTKIREVLLKLPGILVLDEGHTARNDKSNIWNVLTEVETKRRIMLSGTPFQNNFDELLNTLSLVRQEFGSSVLPGKSMMYGRNMTERRGLMNCSLDDDKQIAKLKSMMKPFVHVHKGEILKKTLRGLFHSVLSLKPSDLQKTCFRQLGRLKNGLKLDHLVSIASVHPSLLSSCDQIPDSLKILLKEHRKNVDAGVKIRFLFDLINLAVGEKVLVFSQFLKPLKFIRNLLKTRYNWDDEKELLYMHGNQDAKQRQAFIRHFNNPESEARVLLASTKACCEGIHLVGASRVVLLDVVWNPSVERQAISRAYRLGQQKDVFVYHLITSGTLEEEKYYWQVKKDRVSEKFFPSKEEIKNDEKALPRVSEDRILEEMIENEKIRNMFAKITYQTKADELIDSFGAIEPVGLPLCM